MTPGRHGLKGLASGQYSTPSGRYLIEREEHRENECGCIHCMDSRVWDCPSGGFRVEIAWHVWDETTGDYAKGTGPLQFDTMKEAAEFALDQEGAR